jgi:hypothetical protein
MHASGEMESASAPRPLAAVATGEGGRYRLTLGFPGSARFRGWRGELLVLAFFALAACVLTWPIAGTLELATGVRGDYYNNLWNAWWVGDSLTEWHSPFWTDHLYYPEGISLKRHTLSPLNSFTLLGLTTFLTGHQAFSLLVLLHFALSGWCFSLLARYVTGSLAGGVLGGLVYSFCPFHYFYLCQINIFSFEFLPLALLFGLKHAREGGTRNLAAFVGSMAGMAASAEYYVVYAYLALGLLLLCARDWSGGVRLGVLVRRLTLAGALGALAVALVALPLLWAALGPEGRVDVQTSANAVEKSRYNDLYGFFWIGGDEECTVSWPTMLGYSTLALVLLGFAHVRKHWAWLVVGGAFLVLSLGEELAIGRLKTGIPLPYALFRELPVLSMLRKSDRAFMVVQLAAGVLLAAGFAGLTARLCSQRSRALAFAACAALVSFELCGAPFERFTVPTSPYLDALRDDASVTSVMDLPPMPLHVMNGRYDYYQTLHEKKITLGYTTSIALTPHHDQRLLQLANHYLEYINERNRALPRLAATLGVDLVLHHKTFPNPRPRDPAIDGITVWQPFFRVRRPLIRVRQIGEYVDTPYSEASWDRIRLLLTRALGPPLYEDELLAVFAARNR